MKPVKMVAFLLVGMALVGMTYSVAGQRVFAHDFSEDESATFLVDIWAAKVHLMLVGKNLDNPDRALEHIEHVHMLISDEMLNEIAERNERIANDIPASVDDLAIMIQDGEDRSTIVGQFRDINNLLAEAVSVRIDRDHVREPYVQALLIAGLLDNALTSYEQAHGIASAGHDHSMDENTEEAEHTGNDEIVDHDAHTAAKAFATLAKNAFFREKLVDAGTEDAHDVEVGLVNLREAIYHKHSVDDVTVAVHIGVHDKLRHAFGLELADDHDDHAADDHSDNDHMEEEHEEDSEHL